MLAFLPTLNACLNATAALLLVLGWRAVRARRIQSHRRYMLGACAVGAAFLTSYIVYHAQVGTTRFLGTGIARPIYFTMLTTHTVLAAVQVPLIIVTVTLALRENIQRHRRWAKLTLPIWLYVSITGVLIYVTLYHLYPHATPSPR